MTRINSICAFVALGMSAALLAAPSALAKDPLQPADKASAEFRFEPLRAPAENYRVLRHVVDGVCLTSGPRPLYLRSAERACVRETLDRAVAELGHETIKELHLAATGRRTAETQLAFARR